MCEIKLKKKKKVYVRTHVKIIRDSGNPPLYRQEGQDRLRENQIVKRNATKKKEFFSQFLDVLKKKSNPYLKETLLNYSS